jgi:hypothetical protein
VTRPIREHVSKVRLSGDEHAPIAEAAEREGISCAAFMRRAALLAAKAPAPAAKTPTAPSVDEPWSARAALERSGLRAVR